MIKIEIPDLEDKKTEYRDLLIEKIIERIEPLICSIKHLLGKPIDVQVGNFKRYKFVTEKIIKELIIDKKLEKNKPQKSFIIKEYKLTVETYLQNNFNNSLFKKVNFKGILQFLEFLLAAKNKELKELLICKPEQLRNKENNLLKKFSIQGEIHKQILKRAFNYEEFDEISGLIKCFFRTNNFVKYCPYCNQTEVMFRAIPGGSRVGTTHQLDHFFDKASFPILSYSLFNLVPSDSTCNGINKGNTEFTDDFHLNPYISGFGKNMLFEPIVLNLKVSLIKLSISVSANLNIKHKMLGSSCVIDEIQKEGNINVFTLETKYRDRKEEAERVLNKVYRKEKSNRFHKRFIAKMKGIDLNNHYKIWYFENINSPFDEVKFNDQCYSKFNRDIHDYYYRMNATKGNKYILDLIK